MPPQALRQAFEKADETFLFYFGFSRIQVQLISAMKKCRRNDFPPTFLYVLNILLPGLSADEEDRIICL